MPGSPGIAMTVIWLSFLLMSTGIIFHHALIDRLEQMTAAPSGAPQKDQPGRILTA